MRRCKNAPRQPNR
uniref:Uncharacterized protein n=1 Tax=Arundo donax TaxID=35708 RepID=A0A0A9CLF4_ARUDO